ncbi:hypothetical protein ACE41K_34435, partial [Bacillus cereus]
VSKDTLRRRLNSVGYEYDNSKKKTLYVGEESEKNQIDFTESEILALKDLLHIVKSDEAKLFLELASLPESKES